MSKYSKVIAGLPKRDHKLLSKTVRRNTISIPRRSSELMQISPILSISEELLMLTEPPRPSENKLWYVSCPLFGIIPTKYDPREQARAQAYPYQKVIKVGSDFFYVKTIEDKILVMCHEIGHFFEKLVILKNKTPSYLVALEKSGIFGTATGWDFEGIYGMTSIKEAIAEGFGMYVSPEYNSFLKEDYPDTYKFIEKYFR
jgi:hypothetical protein